VHELVYLHALSAKSVLSTLNQQGEISGAKSSRRTSTYQHGISMYEKMYNHVLPCTAIYCYVLPCIDMYSQKYELVRTCTYFRPFVCTSTYRYVPVCTAMQKFTKITYQYVHHKSTRRYTGKAVHTSTYRYVPPYTRCIEFQMT
jgi:hypothetical protein